MKKLKDFRIISRLFGNTLEQRQESMGYTFILPWFIGMLLFFLYPMIQAIMYVFNDVKIGETGVEYDFVGTRIIKEVFFDNPTNFRLVMESIGGTMFNAILVVAFSLIVAVLLNKPFRGRGLCRALVALPIIVSSGVLMQVFKEDLFRTSIESGTVFQGIVIEASLAKIGLNDSIIELLTKMVSGVLDLIWLSGIQILLFVGGMQSIPRALMEVCEVEGASPWQGFWKVTFPMLSPFLLLNLVYAIIDSFTTPTNEVIIKINEYFNNTLYSSATTMSVVYFIFVLLIVGIASGIITKRVAYVDK